MTDFTYLVYRLPLTSMRMIACLLLTVALSGCVDSSSTDAAVLETSSEFETATATAAASLDTADWLQQSWQTYRQQFIQADGRVIDWEARDRSISEGQAYAMLRAVLIDDPEIFALTLEWAENNLQRRQPDGSPSDRLWAWKWGQDAEGNWDVLDPTFASDADLDAITALILAARRWNRPDYLELARAKLADLWELSTVAIATDEGETRYFLPGPQEAFQPSANRFYINPSYLAPYAFRLFAQVDSTHDWLALIDSSYQLLEDAAQLSTASLPGDWVVLDTETGAILPSTNPALTSVYSFDAYRVWWRVAIDAAWFDEPRAKQYLQTHLPPLVEMWRSQQAIPARIDLAGQPLVDYESTSQYAMLYAALQIVNPDVAQQIRQQRLVPAYANGLWDTDSAYYVQNLAWFGLFPAHQVAAEWLQPTL